MGPERAFATSSPCDRRNCRIIAEGIETDVECDALLRLGIDFGQGYLFGHPEPVEKYF